MTCCASFGVLSSLACRSLLSPRMGVRVGVPIQKLHPLSRAIHHRYTNANSQRTPHRTAARHYTSLSRLPPRTHKYRYGGQWSHGYQQHRTFWVARLATRLLKLRYLVLGSAVGGGYTAKKVSIFRPNSKHCTDVVARPVSEKTI